MKRQKEKILNALKLEILKTPEQAASKEEEKKKESPKNLSNDNSNDQKKTLKPKLNSPIPLQLKPIVIEKIKASTIPAIPPIPINNNSEIKPSGFYGKSSKSEHDTSSLSPFTKSLASKPKPEKPHYDYSAQSSPIRRPQHQNEYLPFQHNYFQTIQKIPYNLQDLGDPENDPPQGTRFIIKGGETDHVLKLICVNDNNEYVLLNNETQSIEFWKQNQIIEIGGPIDDEK